MIEKKFIEIKDLGLKKTFKKILEDKKKNSKKAIKIIEKRFKAIEIRFKMYRFLLQG